MKLSKLTREDIVKITTLQDEREVHQKKVDQIDAKIDAIATKFIPKQVVPSSESLATAKHDVRRQKTAAKPKHRLRRSPLKSTIVAALQKAGTSGLTVKELSTSTSIKVPSLYTWIHSTGKRLKLLKKLANKKYVLKK